MRPASLCFILFLFFSSLIEKNEGKDWYVKSLPENQSGSGTKEDPFGSFREAMESARTGDTIYAFPGIYEGSRNSDLELKPEQSTLFFDVTDVEGEEFLTNSSVVIDLSSEEEYHFFSALSTGRYHVANYIVSFNQYTFIGKTRVSIFEIDLEGEITFNNCHFTENPMIESTALTLNNTIVNINDCVFSSNTEKNSTINANPMPNFLARNSTINMKNSSFFDCGLGTYSTAHGISYPVWEMGSIGGAVNVENSKLILNDVIFSNNNATKGAGMYAIGSSLSLNNVIFKNNTANHGGGLYVIPQDKDITLENKIIFQRNRVVGNGGGLFISNENHDQGNIRIIGASFIENNCSNAGGGIFMSGLSVTLKDSTLENDPRKARGYPQGSLLYIQDCNIVEVENCEITAYVKGANDIEVNNTENAIFRDNTVNGPYPLHFYSNVSQVFFSNTFIDKVSITESEFTVCQANNSYNYDNTSWTLKNSNMVLLNDLTLRTLYLEGNGTSMSSLVDPSICPQGKKENGENIKLYTQDRFQISNYIGRPSHVIIDDIDVEVGQYFKTNAFSWVGRAILELNGYLIVPTIKFEVTHTSIFYNPPENKPLALSGYIKLSETEIQGDVEFLDDSQIVMMQANNNITGKVTIAPQADLDSKNIRLDEEGESIVLLQWETHEGEFQTDTLKEQYFLKYHETYLEKFYGEEKKQEEGFNYLWVLMIVIIGVVVIGGLVFFVIRMKKRSREAGVEHYGGFEDDENLDEADENFDEVDEDEF